VSEETLLTAARRVAKFFRIDQAHGGLVSIETIQAVETLDIQVAREAARQKAAVNDTVKIEDARK
jgi:hypothetical protein